MARSPYVHDPVEDDDGGVLPDGGRRLVRMMLRDGSTVDLEPWQADVIHAHRVGLDDGAALHRPGPRYLTDQAGLDAKAKAYADGVREMTTAWQRQPVADANGKTGVGSGELRGRKPGDQCTINGAPGHLNLRLECVPDKRRADAVPRTMTADDAQPIRDAAWLASIVELQEAWRKA
jgi:hypothetical protein